MHEVTFIGLMKWYEKVFEKYGWMILAQKGNRNDKLSLYQTEVAHLKEAIVDKINKVEENDRKNDLKIMLANVGVLEEYIRNHLVLSAQMGGRKRSGSKKGSRKGSKKGSKKACK